MPKLLPTDVKFEVLGLSTSQCERNINCVCCYIRSFETDISFYQRARLKTSLVLLWVLFEIWLQRNLCEALCVFKESQPCQQRVRSSRRWQRGFSRRRMCVALTSTSLSPFNPSPTIDLVCSDVPEWFWFGWSKLLSLHWWGGEVLLRRGTITVSFIQDIFKKNMHSPV